MLGRPKALETVARETPAALATSLMVGAEREGEEVTFAVYALAGSTPNFSRDKF